MNPKHEPKACPRCGGGFECKVGNVLQCQCMAVPLDTEDRAYIQARYEDCLCAACMKALQRERHAEIWADLYRRWQSSH